MKQVVVEIATDGSTTVDSQGFKGNTCTIATRELELALAGGGDISDKKKPDYYAQNPQTNRQVN